MTQRIASFVARRIPAWCATFALLVGAHAQEPASPQAAGVPAHAVTLAQTQVGDFLKFRQVSRVGTQSEVLTLWHQLRAKTDEAATFRVVMTNRGWTPFEPIETAANDVRIDEGTLPPTATLLDSGFPPSVKVLSDVITKLAPQTLFVGPRTLECQVFERITEIEVPEGKLRLRNRTWWNESIPVSGLVRNENETTGVQQGTSSSELVAYSGMNDPTKIHVENPMWFHAQAWFAIEASGEGQSPRDQFFEKLGDAYLSHRSFDNALSLLSNIAEPVYRRSLESALRAYAAYETDAAHRTRVGLTDAAQIEDQLLYFAHNYGNVLERSSIEEIAEQFAARLSTTANKDNLWGAVYARAITAGDRARAAAAFARLSSDEARRSAVDGAAYNTYSARSLEAQQLLAELDPDALKRAAFLRWHYPLLEELHREQESFDAARRYVAAVLAEPRAKLAEEATSVATIAGFRPWSPIEPFVVASLSAALGNGDAEAELAATRAERAASASAAAGDDEGDEFDDFDDGVDLAGYFVSTFASRAAAKGDEAAMARILATIAEPASADHHGPIVALYRAGKREEAAAWLAKLPQGATEHPFHVEGARARIALAFATHARFVGEKEEAARWLDAAERSALAAQVGIAAHNKQTGGGLYWQGGVSMKSSAPCVLVGVRLIANGEHERALEFARQLPSLRPMSSDVEQVWEELAFDACLRGDEVFATKVFEALPSFFDANSRNWFVRKMGRHFALGGDLEGVQTFSKSLKDEHQRNGVISSAIVRLALDGKAKEALLLYEPWIAMQKPKEGSDARVMVALALAAAGDAQRAMELVDSPRHAIDLRELTGVDASAVLIALGLHVARGRPDLNELARWLIRVESPNERAYVGLGLALGLAQGPVPDEFVLPLKTSAP